MLVAFRTDSKMLIAFPTDSENRRTPDADKHWCSSILEERNEKKTETKFEVLTKLAVLIMIWAE